MSADSGFCRFIAGPALRQAPALLSRHSPSPLSKGLDVSTALLAFSTSLSVPCLARYGTRCLWIPPKVRLTFHHFCRQDRGLCLVAVSLDSSPRHSIDTNRPSIVFTRLLPPSQSCINGNIRIISNLHLRPRRPPLINRSENTSTGDIQNSLPWPRPLCSHPVLTILLSLLYTPTTNTINLKRRRRRHLHQLPAPPPAT